jgi:type VI secretion system secreted protein Hcp
MAADFLLKIDGVTGDWDHEGYEGAIELLSWSWGVSVQPAARGTSAGRPEFDELQVVAAVGSASPQLVESCVTGRSHRRVQLIAVRQGDDGRDFEFLRYEFGNVTITNVEHGEDDDRLPIEELALSYETFTITFVGQDRDGSPGRQSSFSHP